MLTTTFHILILTNLKLNFDSLEIQKSTILKYIIYSVEKLTSILWKDNTLN